MANGDQTAVLDGIRRLYAGDSVAGLATGVLLDRYATRRDEASFAAIVARHGPMVLGVCRRALRDPHDVEDAFQATFLILVEKASQIRDAEGLGPWLHGVARRVATRAERRQHRRPEPLAVDPAAPVVDPDHSESWRIVDDEIGRLPDRYRRPVILCDLEGLTQAEAARQLDWTEGTVRGRLARRPRPAPVPPDSSRPGRGVGDDRRPGHRRGRFGRATRGNDGSGRRRGCLDVGRRAGKGGSGCMTRLKLIGLGLGAVVAGMVVAGGGRSPPRGRGPPCPARRSPRRSSRLKSSASLGSKMSEATRARAGTGERAANFRRRPPDDRDPGIASGSPGDRQSPCPSRWDGGPGVLW